MGKAVERIFLPLVRMMIPELVDYDLPTFGDFHNFAFTPHPALSPRGVGRGRRVRGATSAQSPGAPGFTKIIVFVDHDVNVHDNDRVWFHVGSNVRPLTNQGPTDPGAAALTTRDLVTRRWAIGDFAEMPHNAQDPVNLARCRNRFCRLACIGLNCP